MSCIGVLGWVGFSGFQGFRVSGLNEVQKQEPPRSASKVFVR